MKKETSQKKRVLEQSALHGYQMKPLELIKNDPYLEPYETAIRGRYEFALATEKRLTRQGKSTLSDFASGYLYFGLHRTQDGWVFREWAPNATALYLVGDFND